MATQPLLVRDCPSIDMRCLESGRSYETGYENKLTGRNLIFLLVVQ
jgi:hypothetical protein